MHLRRGLRTDQITFDHRPRLLCVLPHQQLFLFGLFNSYPLFNVLLVLPLEVLDDFLRPLVDPRSERQLRVRHSLGHGTAAAFRVHCRESGRRLGFGRRQFGHRYAVDGFLARSRRATRLDKQG